MKMQGERASGMPAPTRSEGGYPSALLAWFFVAVLTVAHAVAFIDRQLLTLVVDDVKLDLHLTDTQIGLVHGSVFALFHAVFGLPIARLADLHSRKNVMIGGVAVWSAATAFCGLAGSYFQLLFARIFVAAGEASLGPSSYSVISDCFRPGTRAGPLGVYTAGGVAGIGLSLVLGGLLLGALEGADLGTWSPWQIIFISASLLGIFPAVALLMPEPARHSDPRAAALVKKADTEAVPLGLVIKANWKIYLPLVLAYASLALVGYTMTSWIPTYFMRVLHLPAEQTGLLLGLAIMTGGITGSVLGGFVSDFLERRLGGGAKLMVVFLACLAVTIPSFGVAFVNSAPLVAVMVGLAYFTGVIALGPVIATIQEITPSRARAQISAGFLFMTSITGLGLGPVLVGLVTDYVFQDPMAVGWSIAIVSATAAVSACLFAGITWRTYTKLVVLPTS
jgi:MFS family permease